MARPSVEQMNPFQHHLMPACGTPLEVTGSEELPTTKNYADPVMKSWKPSHKKQQIATVLTTWSDPTVGIP